MRQNRGKTAIERSLLVLTMCLLSGAVAHARAEEQRHGKEMLQKLCAGCHSIARTGNSPNRQAPGLLIWMNNAKQIPPAAALETELAARLERTIRADLKLQDRSVAKQLTERPLAISRDTPTLDRHGLNLRPMPPALMPEPKSAPR